MLRDFTRGVESLSRTLLRGEASPESHRPRPVTDTAGANVTLLSTPRTTFRQTILELPTQRTPCSSLHRLLRRCSFWPRESAGRDRDPSLQALWKITITSPAHHTPTRFGGRRESRLSSFEDRDKTGAYALSMQATGGIQRRHQDGATRFLHASLYFSNTGLVEDEDLLPHSSPRLIFSEVDAGSTSVDQSESNSVLPRIQSSVSQNCLPDADFRYEVENKVRRPLRSTVTWASKYERHDVLDLRRLYKGRRLPGWPDSRARYRSEHGLWR